MGILLSRMGEGLRMMVNLRTQADCGTESCKQPADGMLVPYSAAAASGMNLKPIPPALAVVERTTAPHIIIIIIIITIIMPRQDDDRKLGKSGKQREGKGKKKNINK